ncbi:MAG: glycosyltransferase family 4 protein [Planctomycetota bacterium]|nr:MAG: glycosyltransferase family 4 protein [Planctomycetota bacterium]
MKILVVTSLYPSPPRPYEGVFAELRWTGMAQRGHEVRVLHPQPRTPWPFVQGAWAEIHEMPKRELRAGIDVERPRYLHVPGRSRGNAQRFARRALSRVRADDDVVVCDYAWPAAALAPLLAGRGVPCVVSGRGSDVLEVAGEAGLGAELAGFLAAASGWCGVSRDLVRAMDELAGAPGRGRLVPNGVDTERFRPRDRADARRRLGIDGGGALVLVVGHLIERKDPLLAIAAFERAGLPEAELVFIGRGPMEERMRAAIAASGAGSRVRMVGEKTPDELADWLAACDVLLLTSRREGRPNVVLEALASGRPVVATAAGGTGELLRDERMLVLERSPEALGAALAAVLADPPSPDATRASVADLSWAASLAALEECLEHAVGGAKAIA